MVGTDPSSSKEEAPQGAGKRNPAPAWAGAGPGGALGFGGRV